MKKELGITSDKFKETSEWYEQVCLKSRVADFGDIKGTIVIRPRGYYMWEQVQKYFNDNILTKFNVDNCYFPLFIPKSFFKKEAEHAKGFAPELAWITTATDTGEEEKAIIRPTSETIIVDSFRKWLRTYRDLPIKVNQWANVVRWEVSQTKLFLRGREFLWQEGHCIYKTREECEKDVIGILEAYEDLCKNVLAVPVIKGRKTPGDKFPGAVDTYCIEALMPDGKALQMGTSHYLGQGFMKVFGVKYMGEDEKEHEPHYNSWGVSTRLLGATIMTHSDNKGLILPPGLVKNKIVIVPALKKDNAERVLKYAEEVKKTLSKFNPSIDDREGYSMGFKINDAELVGTPMVIIVGDKEIDDKTVTVKIRDEDAKEVVKLKDLDPKSIFAEMHERLYQKAKAFQDERVVEVSTFEELKKQGQAGNFVKAHYLPSDAESEESLKAEAGGVGARCIVTDEKSKGKCIYTGKETDIVVYFARNY